jgi:hypothetical protein
MYKLPKITQNLWRKLTVESQHITIKSYSLSSPDMAVKYSGEAIIKCTESATYLVCKIFQIIETQIKINYLKGDYSENYCERNYFYRIDSVSMATRLRAGRSGFWGSIPGMGCEFLSSPPCPDRFWGPPSLLSNGYRGLSLGVKRPGHEADHSHLVPRPRMRGAIPPQYVFMEWCLVKYGDNFTFTFYVLTFKRTFTNG